MDSWNDKDFYTRPGKLGWPSAARKACSSFSCAWGLCDHELAVPAKGCELEGDLGMLNGWRILAVRIDMGLL